VKQKQQVGGGVKKILYAMQTINRIGLLDSKKALTSRNTCKACGLGMGGQLGGMTNEQGDFPAVCNKSVQAQSTDIQAPIPDEIFDYDLEDFRQLSAHELEHLGRLGQPIYKAQNDNNYKVVNWDWALDHASQKFIASPPEQSFFYSSGRSSNEAAFVLQLLARMYGTNNVNNCSYYCHQATSVGLGSTIGTGTATVELDDLDGCDLIFLIGANPASNHPRFIYKLKECRERGGQVVVINPAKEPGLIKFAVPKSPKSMLQGGSDIASHYLQPKVGSDVVLLKGIAKYIIVNNKQNQSFINNYLSGYSDFLDDIKSIKWHQIENATGLKKVDIEQVAKVYAKSTNTIFAWGMGITHHQHGVENVEYISNLALLRGMIGRPFAGLLPLRGHSNVQGIGTIGVKPVLAEDMINRMEAELGVKFADTNNTPGLDTLACIEAADQGKMRNALIMGGNLLQATPNYNWAQSALDKVDFKCYLTTTLNKGHIHACENSEVLVLPVTARDEEPQATTQESMFNYVRLSDGGITRIANARSEVSILSDFADRVLGSNSLDFQAFNSHSNIRKAIAAIVPGMQEIADIDVARKEFHIKNRLMHEPKFNRPSGKANFVTHSTQQEKQNLRFPFKLMSVRSEGQFNSIIYEEKDSYRNISQRWSIMMNQQDMSTLSIQEGDTMTVRSQYGEMVDVVVCLFDVPIGNVMAYYPEANILIGLERDARSQTPAFKSVDVNVVR